MVVPTVGVIVVDYHRRAVPIRLALQEINYIDDELLLVQWIGVTRMAILVSRRLQETHRGKVPGLNSRVEIQNVILVIRAIRLTDSGNRSRTHVCRVCSGRIILERLVVRNVIVFERPGDRRSRLPVAARGSIWIHDAEVETAFEEAPGHARRIQQAADVLAAHLKGLAACGGADISARIRVADVGHPSVSITY